MVNGRLMTRGGRRKIGRWWARLRLWSILALFLVAYAISQPGLVPAVGPLVGGREEVQARFTRCGEVPSRACVVDGDTFHIRGRKIRLLDIDTPEIRDARCAEERRLGEDAAAMLLAELNRGGVVMVTDIREDRDRFGRELKQVVRVEDGRDVSIGDRLIDAGLAQPYFGHKATWC